MRLTLRTLLAYRDGVLRPADAEDLHRRIQKSEYAGNILRRINAVSKRSYATSTIVGKGPGGDPNAYAEYLDDVMPSEKIPEFERACLESDQHLAELAVCHSLLGSAMKETVRVPESLRELAASIGRSEKRDAISQGLSFRKQRLGGATKIVRADVAHQSGNSKAAGSATPDGKPSTNHPQEQQQVRVQAPMLASGGGSIKPQGLDLEDSALAAEVPSYLVGRPPFNWRTPLAIGALLGLLGVLTWQVLGPWDEIKQLFVSSASEGEAGDQLQPSSGERGATSRGSGDGAANLAAASSRKDSADVEATPGPVASKEDSSDSEGPRPQVVEPESDASSAESTSQEESAAPVSESESATESPANQPPQADVEGAWLPKDDAERAAVLLSRKADSKLVRLQPGDILERGSRLIVPPYYRTTVDLPGGTLWTTCGPSVLSIGDRDDSHIRTAFCRGLVRGGPLGNQLKIATPAGACEIGLNGVSSMAALEVGSRPKINGSVLDSRAYVPVMIIVAYEGDLQVTHDSQRFDLELGKGLAFVGDTRPKEFELKNIPRWYRAGVDRPIDEIAAEDFVDLLRKGADANMTLEDQLTSLGRSPKPYVAALAAQTSLLVGNWKPFIADLLVNPRLSSYWEPAIDLARRLLAAQPAGADEVRSAFSADSIQGDSLFKMLIGYSEAELEGGGFSMLVSQLAEDDLRSRVLAWYQLKHATGKVLGFLPHDPNRASIQLWRRELATKRLKVLPVDDIIAERRAP